jgi:hypothetical protein
MRSMKCSVEFGCQLSIRSGTKENHGKPWSSWPVAGPSGCKLTSSQKSGIEYATPNIVSLSVRLLYYKIRIQFVLQMFYIHIQIHRLSIGTTRTLQKITCRAILLLLLVLMLLLSSCLTMVWNTNVDTKIYGKDLCSAQFRCCLCHDVNTNFPKAFKSWYGGCTDSMMIA